MSKSARKLLVDDSRMDVELALDGFEQARLFNRVEVANSGLQAKATPIIIKNRSHHSQLFEAR